MAGANRVTASTDSGYSAFRRSSMRTMAGPLRA